MPRGLTPKQEAFVREYLSNGRDASAAYRKCYNAKGSSDKVIWVNACKLLKSAKVALRVEQVIENVQRRTEITVERVLTEYAKLGFADIRKAVRWRNEMGQNDEGALESNIMLVPSDELDDDTAAAISEVSETQQGLKIKLHDKKGALDSIARNLGMFNDKLTLDIKVDLRARMLEARKRRAAG